MGCFACMWCGRLYCQGQGSAVGHMGQQTETLEDRLDDDDVLATAYEKLSLLAHVDFAKLIFSLVAAPFRFLR